MGGGGGRKKNNWGQKGNKKMNKKYIFVTFVVVLWVAVMVCILPLNPYQEEKQKQENHIKYYKVEGAVFRYESNLKFSFIEGKKFTKAM